MNLLQVLIVSASIQLPMDVELLYRDTTVYLQKEIFIERDKKKLIIDGIRLNIKTSIINTYYNAHKTYICYDGDGRKCILSIYNEMMILTSVDGSYPNIVLRLWQKKR